MGFRFRKSINLGGGFKINISKSGVGYSWGTKGFRVTKKSTGGTRTTASIYGTGLSYVSETGKKKHSAGSKGKQPAVQQPDLNTYDTRNIENSVASGMVSEGLEEMLALASKAIKTYKAITVVFWLSVVAGFMEAGFWLISIACFIGGIVCRKKGAISLDYDIDEDMKAEIVEQMQPLIKITECDKVWRLTQTSKVLDSKYASGAANTVKRKLCITSTKATFPFRTTEKIASFRTDKEVLLFLPDKLLILQGSKIGALNYSDIDFDGHTTRFIEDEKVPKDATIVDQTWQYVNKSGGADKRFKNNKKLPICLYGKLEMTSASGLDTVIMFSNPNL